ncbi:cytidylate kinase-like family protein [Colidextribacter sp. 210702-DFI.3.9]|nr:cytidylate kinase-like family protein [Colidextribacter sp. 210702-DFI.3.9]
MDDNMTMRLEIARRIYDLDAEVYRVLGSSLGRVFNSDRDMTVRRLANLMGDFTQGHYLRSELALISNMARTIAVKADRSRLMTEYNEILHALDKLPTNFNSLDILDPKMAHLNSLRLNRRFDQGNHLVVCIGRTYGSAGTDIGFALADALKINYYDSEIFTEVLERMEADPKSVQDRVSFAHKQNLNQSLGLDRYRGIKARLQEFNRYHGLPTEDALFFNQSGLLCDMAKREDFIIMGRCADVILSNNGIPHISLFINAPFNLRVRRVMDTDGLDKKGAVKLLHQLDRRHRHYYEFYTGRRWGDPANYDLCLNSASYGIDGSVALVRQLIEKSRESAKD